jgi:hypothetical protein
MLMGCWFCVAQIRSEMIDETSNRYNNNYLEYQTTAVDSSTFQLTRDHIYNMDVSREQHRHHINYTTFSKLTTMKISCINLWDYVLSPAFSHYSALPRNHPRCSLHYNPGRRIHTYFFLCHVSIYSVLFFFRWQIAFFHLVSDFRGWVG